jgi:hypothetical protein
MKPLLFAAALLLFAACYHDNASPFVHGSHNDPRRGGSKTTASAPAQTNSSGASAGGVNKK